MTPVQQVGSRSSDIYTVANLPHLWPLISRIFGLGSFKASTGVSGSNQYPLRSHRSGAAIPSARRTKFESQGYITTNSEERIPVGGEKEMHWGYAKQMDSGDSSDGDLESGKGYMTTTVHAGEIHDDMSPPATGQALGGWPNENRSGPNRGHIVKTVDINQYES